MVKTDKIVPFLVFSDENGNVYEDTNYIAAGRSGSSFKPLHHEVLIELPKGSDLFVLPKRHPVAFTKNGQLTVIDDVTAVAAFLSPAHTQTLLSAFFKENEDAPTLPLFAYTAVGWYEGKFYVPAVRIDKDIRQEPYLFDQKKVIKFGKEILKSFKKNRLVEHIVKDCAFTYLCPAARNFVLGRYEAPLPTSPLCNSRCLGCISFQKKASKVPCTQPRITFVPTAEEIAETALFHLERAKDGVVSFGQGCEGEPLLVGEVILEAIKIIRKKTVNGIINLNTNGSLPDMVEKLFQNGLDSIRVSMNSSVPEFYEKYYQPKNYSFSDVKRTLTMGKKYKKWVSINYFVFPGLTDREEEYKSLHGLIKETEITMIQWRNFNIDPDWYLQHLGIKNVTGEIGVRKMMKLLKKAFPLLHYGYFNPLPSVVNKLK